MLTESLEVLVGGHVALRCEAEDGSFIFPVHP